MVVILLRIARLALVVLKVGVELLAMFLLLVIRFVSAMNVTARMVALSILSLAVANA